MTYSVRTDRIFMLNSEEGEFMNKLIVFVLSIMTLIISAVALSPTVGASSACHIERLALNAPAGKIFVVNGDKVKANFEVKGQDCHMAVTLAVWKSPSANGAPIKDQKLFGHVTNVFGPGKHALTAKIPDCYFQADLLEGSSPTAADGSANYDYQNGVIFDGGLRDFMFGGTNVCSTPVVPVTPTQTQPQSTVKELPNTGLGLSSMIGLASATAIASSVAFHFVQKQRLIKNII